MKKNFITGFWFLFNFIHMYVISGNTTIDKSSVIASLGGESTIKRSNIWDVYLGPDYAPIIIAVLSMAGIILFNNFFRKEKNTLISNIEIFIVMLLINLIMFRLRVNVVY